MTRTLDSNGRETTLAEGGYTSSFGYNADDQTTAITLPNGVSEQASYDANGRLVSWHDPGPGQNVTYGYGYDAASRVTSFTAVSGTDYGGPFCQDTGEGHFKVGTAPFSRRLAGLCRLSLTRGAAAGAT